MARNKWVVHKTKEWKKQNKNINQVITTFLEINLQQCMHFAWVNPIKSNGKRNKSLSAKSRNATSNWPNIQIWSFVCAHTHGTILSVIKPRRKSREGNIVLTLNINASILLNRFFFNCNRNEQKKTVTHYIPFNNKLFNKRKICEIIGDCFVYLVFCCSSKSKGLQSINIAKRQ